MTNTPSPDEAFEIALAEYTLAWEAFQYGSSASNRLRVEQRKTAVRAAHESALSRARRDYELCHETRGDLLEMIREAVGSYRYDGQWHVNGVDHSTVKGAVDSMLSRVRADEQKKYEWQPMATAPKDGTEVVITGYHDGVPGGKRWCATAMYRYGEWVETEDLPAPFYEPTHWMPLPSPPSHQTPGV